MMKCHIVKFAYLRGAPVAALLLALCPAFAASPSNDPKPKDLRITRPDNGAIAYHRASGSFGYAVDRRTSRDAKVEALKQCSNADCEVVLSLKGGCGAIASFQKTFFASRGVTRAEAEAKAKRQCGPNCAVVVWACTK